MVYWNVSNVPRSFNIGGTQVSIYEGTVIAGLDAVDGTLNWLKSRDSGDLGAVLGYGVDVGGSGSIYFAGTGTFESDSITIDENHLNSTYSQLPLVGKLSFYNSKITGRVFRDYDLDHEIDPLEPFVDHEIVELIDGYGDSKYKTTTINGYYYFWVDSGSYTVTYAPPQNFLETAGILDYNLAGVYDTIINGLNFGLNYSDTVLDLMVDVTVVPFQPYYINSGQRAWTSAMNIGNTISAYTTNVNVSGNANVTGFNQETDTLALGQLSTDWIMFTAVFGPHTISTNITSFSNLTEETLLINNSDSTEVVILNDICCPSDPNDKTVNKGECEANYVEKGDTLKYLIRFMNTGTAPAQNVVIIDTVDYAALDLQTFRVIGHSHDMDWDISGPGKLTITFPNIQLPDSSVSFFDSQGFFKYEIVLRDTIANFTHTGQPAYIYFDYEEVVITNTPTIIAVDSIPASQITATDAICDGQFGEIGAELSFGLNIDSATWSNGATGLPLLYNVEDVYIVELVDQYGCHYLDSIEVDCQIVTTTGQSQTQSHILVYPNPSKGVIEVTWDSADEKLSYTVSNIVGQDMLQGTLDRFSSQINLSKFDEGHYLIKFIDQKDNETTLKVSVIR